MAVLKNIPKTLYEDNKYCPGCGHGIVNRIFAEVLEELGLDKKAIGIVAVGCSCLMPESFGVDWIQAPHGRAPAVATGIKRVRPDNFVFTYQGDGDAAAIGLSETLYTAQRNENITTIFVNNGVFGMTGGQMAPTTLKGQKTTTSLNGRDTELTGMPMRVAEMINNFDVSYIARGAVTSFREINKTKQYIKRAVECQLNNEGYSFVEILSPCPTNWHMDPVKSMKRIEEEVFNYYQLGEIKRKGEQVI